MAKYKLEYIWLDGYTPVPNIRGKTLVKDFDKFPKLDEVPNWGFDGSSTRQAEGHSSDCVLKPVAVYPDSTKKNGAIVMCEVLHADLTPHSTNARATILDDPDTWFGFEQEYFLYKDGRPLGFPEHGYPAPQGPYYTGVGYENVGDIAREIVDTHLDICLDAGINHEGINAEVAKGQWEFQIFGKGSRKAADEMWVARYLLQRLCEKYKVDVNYHCKPLGATDWNGSGMHSNFSTKYMREVGGKEYFEKLMGAFDKYKNEHIAVYGPDNLRTQADLDAIDGLILPGGESTTMLKLIGEENLFDSLRRFGQNRPMFGTCAGAILLATEVLRPEQASLGLMDLTVERNAYGRQIDSRIASLELEGKQTEAVFIRAPVIRRVGPGVRVLAKYAGDPVLAEEGKHMVATFHPELTSDESIHRRFVDKVLALKDEKAA